MRVHEATLAHVRALVTRLQAVPNGFYASRLRVSTRKTSAPKRIFLPSRSPIKMICVRLSLGPGRRSPREIVRVHASSGTTGAPVVIPYTKKDIADWADMMAHSLAIAGIGPDDRLQIATGFGMWTAGSGFQRASSA